MTEKHHSPPKTSKTCAIYASSATSKAASIAMQVERWREVARQNGWDISENDIYADTGASR
jgi:hypothetical protein